MTSISTTQIDRHTQGMLDAARLICPYCKREGRPLQNEMGVSVHRTYSSRGLGSDHECRAQEIYDALGEQCDSKVDL